MPHRSRRAQGAETETARADGRGARRSRHDQAADRLDRAGRPDAAAAPSAAGRARPPPGGRPSGRRRRYLVLGTVSLVVGLGTAAFTVGGGGDAAPGPRITPPVKMYSVEHAITTGEVPFPAPTAESSSNAPVP